MNWQLLISIIVVVASIAGLFHAVKTQKPKGGWILTLVAGVYGIVAFSLR